MRIDLACFLMLYHPVTCLKTVFFCVRWCLGLQDNKTLLALNIAENKIGPEGAASLAKALTVLARRVTYLYWCLWCAEHLFVLS